MIFARIFRIYLFFYRVPLRILNGFMWRIQKEPPIVVRYIGISDGYVVLITFFYVFLRSGTGNGDCRR
jgi:hypothetical protein